jgi:hypothetical protein
MIGIPWNDGEALGRLNDWLSWVGWSLTALGVILTAFSLWVGQRVAVLDAVAARSQAEKILELENKTKTPTTSERLFTLFDRVDPKFRAAVESGHYSFTAFLREFEYGTLKAIAKEDDRIQLTPSTNTRVDNEGAVIQVFIQIKPEVFAK